MIFLELPPEAVDVNVHPTKAEVRFREPQRIFAWVRGGAEEAWAKLRGGLASVLEMPPRPMEAEFDLDPSRPRASQHPRLWSDHSDGAQGAYQAIADAFATRPLDKPIPSKLRPQGWPKERIPAPRFATSGPSSAPTCWRRLSGRLALSFGSWINTWPMSGSSLSGFSCTAMPPAIQPLMPSQVVQVGPEALARLMPFLVELEAAGVEAEPFGGDALAVRGLPDFLIDRDPQALLEDLLARLEQDGRLDLDTFRRDLNAELACRAAIKKHHALPPDLALGLIQDLLACDVPNTCPHGRPILKKLSLDDLERSFGRKM